MADYERPDMSAVGASATVSKKASADSRKELTSFSVRKGDNGGVLICETRESKPPEGRRASAAFPMSSDYKENPYGPTDGGAVRAHLAGLLAEMTGSGMPEPETAGPARSTPTPATRPETAPAPPPRPAAMSALAGGPGPTPVAVTGKRPTPLRPV